MMFLVFAGAAYAGTWQWIDGQRVQARLKEGSGLWIIDVRGAAAYQTAHIEGSVNIPSDVLKHKKFPAQKTLILVDDALGQRSAREAADGLIKKGQEQVSVLEGGIPAWRIEGLPLVESTTSVQGVTADELKWARAQSVPLTLYDLRNAGEREREQLQNSDAVEGTTVAERVEKLKTMLAGNEKKKDLATRIQKPQPVVLVFSASDDAEGFTRKVLQGTRRDVRYLIGGYEAMISDKLRGQQTSGVCPTCPGKGK